MSVVSARSTMTTVSSILKSGNLRGNLQASNKNRVTFELPKNLSQILINYEQGTERKNYQALVLTLKEANIKDIEFLALLQEVKTCISQLNNDHAELVDSLLQVSWIKRNKEATDAYKAFLEDLVCVHTYHCMRVIQRLISFLTIEEVGQKWEDNKPCEQDIVVMNHIHNVFSKFLKIIPMSNDLLLKSLKDKYPWRKKSSYLHQRYLYFLLQITEYAPQLRTDILLTIVEKLTSLDVHISREVILDYRRELEDDEEEEIFQMDSENNTEIKDHPLAHTLDICMDMFMTYIYDCCHPDGKMNQDNVKKMYFELLQCFEKIILPTEWPSQIQFVMFYFCSFNTGIAKAFLSWLWQKVVNENGQTHTNIRQVSICYIESLLARGNFITFSLLTDYIKKMSVWINEYIKSHNKPEHAYCDVSAHAVFYSMCKAVFYVVAFKSRDLTSTPENLKFLENLGLGNMVTCNLNPLRACDARFVQRFADVMRDYEIVYCHSKINDNLRNNLPVIQTTKKFVKQLEVFYPFDAYVLLQSSEKIKPIYQEYQAANPALRSKEILNTENSNMENDEDDYMDDFGTPHPEDSVINPLMEQCSSPPNFMET
ncbi:RNA polymerase I-specific transcription initiation factor RRN3 [Cotesia glomerata]|uniref:RNA polymerase I-specific transcription initiation factor RRN3 n=1 Tax=Cotesia glomerata TaxID=32391 RepID=A0AAV7IXP6_COTGL|nr:RNA polymerase I-specific transcription initiation factor RRN3 [Cotesia glomerata]KAH0561597.1 hypothetical protein KQX54_017968 [Cotesia glomerata]